MTQQLELLSHTETYEHVFVSVPQPVMN